MSPRTPRKLRSPATPGTSPASSQAKSPKTNTKAVNGATSEPKKNEVFTNDTGPANGSTIVSEKDVHTNGKGLPNGRPDTSDKRANAANTSSPRQLPPKRFNTIVRQLSGVKEDANGATSHEAQSAAGAKDMTLPARKKQPRKLSTVVNGANGANGAHATNGANGVNGVT
jgi:hypothetical protein